MRRFVSRLVVASRRMASSFAEHKIDEGNPHWMDFYSRHESNIDMVPINSTRPERELAILEIPNKNSNAPYAFFIHGSCARMGQFESLIELLSPSFHIIAFDRIGCGMSSKPTEFEAYHDVQIFADLCAIFERYIPQSSTLQDTKHEIMIIGHSFGCCQTVKLMAKYGHSPDHNFLVRAAILIGPPALILGHPMPWMPWTIFSLPHFILERMSSGLSASFRKSAIAPDSKKVHYLEETFAGWNKPSMYTSFYLQIDPVTEEQLKAFCQCGINTMVLHGAGDGLVSLDSINTLVDKMKEHREEEQMQNLVNMEVISKASHQCMQEDPLYVSKAIEQIWFRSTENTEITSQDDEES